MPQSLGKLPWQRSPVLQLPVVGIRSTAESQPPSFFYPITSETSQERGKERNGLERRGLREHRDLIFPQLSPLLP